MPTQSFFLSFTAILFYILTALLVFRNVKNGSGTLTPGASILWITALITHALVATRFFTPEGLDLTLLHAVSIVCLLLAVALLFSCFSQRLASLGIVVLPVVAASIALSALDDHRYMFSNTASFGIRIHILGSFIAYGVLSLACVQAFALDAQRKRLQMHRFGAVLNALPPLDAMERFLILLLSIGIAFLSVGIISGLLTFDDVPFRHLAHKTFFSITAWLIFFALLIGYFTNRLHGGKVVALTIWGTASLLLAYFGSKFVIEFLLNG